MKVKTPTWSGKADEAAMYLTKFKAMCECSGLGDAITPGVTIISGATYAGESNKTIPRCKLFEQNRKAGAIFILGQESAHGVAFQTSTINATDTHGKIADALVAMERKYQPSDTTAELELDTALESLKFGGGDANSYYNAVVRIMTQYSVTKSDTDLIKLMARKVTSATYTKMIIDHMVAGTANNFQELCNQISTVQRLVGVSNSNSNGKKKNAEKEIAVVETETAEKKKSGKNVTCNHCHKKGHVEANCWKKHPEKIPQWVRDKQAKRAEKEKSASETGNVEVVVASIEGSDFQRARC